MLQDLPGELLKLVASFLPQPAPFLASCRAASRLSTDPHALSLWLLHTHGPADAILHCTKSPCTKRWPLPRIHEVIQHCLDAGAQLPPAGLALAVLHWAAVTLGDGAVLQLLLSRLLEVHTVHASEAAPAAATTTPLWQACMDPKSLGGQLLTDACAAGRGSAVRVLLQAGAVPRDSSALKAAAENGHAEVVSELLASGCVDPRLNNDFALRMAAKCGHVPVMRLLFAAGCSASAKQGEALVLAVGGGHIDAVRLLLQEGADAGERAGMLQLAAGICPPAPRGQAGAVSEPEGASDGGPEDGEELALALVEALVAGGAGDGDGLGLITAAGAGRGRLVDLLLRRCCYRQEASLGGEDAAAEAGAGGIGIAGGGAGSYEPLAAALQCALLNGHMHVARRLLEAGAPMDMALLASRRYRFPDRQALLQLLDGFPASVRCSQDLDEELTAAAGDVDDTFTCLLLRWGANPTGRECQALRKAVLHGRVASVRAIIGAAGVAGLRRQMPCCVMRAAVQRGHLEVVSELLSAGLWPSASAHHCCADPPTCVARMLCAANSLAMASLLMRFGAAAKAAEALRLVACGRAPSWRNEEVVHMVMDAMLGACVEQQQQQQQQQQHRGQQGGGGVGGEKVGPECTHQLLPPASEGGAGGAVEDGCHHELEESRQAGAGAAPGPGSSGGGGSGGAGREEGREGELLELGIAALRI